MSYEKVDLKSATIVDVREVFECKRGMVPGSINIPLGDVVNRLEDFKTMRKPLVLCCASGGRSGQAVQFLIDNGVNEVYNGGGWKKIAVRVAV